MDRGHQVQGGLLVATALLLPPLSAVAAAPPDAGRLLQEQQQLRPQLPPETPDIGLEPKVERVPDVPDGPRIRVAGFRFLGDLAQVLEPELQEVVKPYVDQDLSFPGLQKVADEVTQYLRGRQYPLARAYLAAQEIRDGIVEITIVLGRVEGDQRGSGIVVRGTGLRLSEERIRRTVAAAMFSDGPYVRTPELERGLLLLNDLPGVTGRGTLEPGAAPGTTRLGLDVAEGPLVFGSLWGDNFGNRYTGAERANAQVYLNNPLRLGDQAIVQGTLTARMHMARFAYAVPIGYSGWRLTADATDLEYRVGKELAHLNARGDARMYSAHLGYPFIRTRQASLFGNFGHTWKALRDESAGIRVADKRVQAWTAGFTGNVYDAFGGGGTTAYGLLLSAGDLDLSRVPGALVADQAGPQAHGGYAKINYSVLRLQRLSERWAFFGGVNGQLADGNLDSSEKFLLGGATGVRAFPTGEGSGDSGWLANLELRYDVPRVNALGSWQLVGFFDIGGVTVNRRTWLGWNAANPAQRNRYTLSGAGVGVNLTKPGSYAVRASYAWKVSSNPGRTAAALDADGRSLSGRLWLQALLHF